MGSPALFSLSNEQPARTTPSTAPTQLTKELDLPNSGFSIRKPTYLEIEAVDTFSKISFIRIKVRVWPMSALPLSVLFQGVQSSDQDNGAYSPHPQDASTTTWKCSSFSPFCPVNLYASSFRPWLKLSHSQGNLS